MANDIFTVSTVFETKGQAESEKALRDNEAATKRYEQATRQLSSRMKVSVDRTNAKAKTLGQLDSATKRAENEIKRLSTSVEQGAITGGQYQGRLNQIAAQLRRMGLQDAQSRVMSYGRATREATTVVRQHEAAQRSLQPALNNTRARTQALTTATNSSNTAQQRARQRFLATANSIAVLDGPLGGIASRFSAFGVLIGRIGIPLAALSIGLATFTFTAQRAIREFSEWERELSTIENRLNSVGNQINLTTGQISNLAQTIALETLASEADVLQAANSLLTFRNISTEIFEDVLRSAQDLSASGFGQVTDQTLRLAKALEDPRQGLTSLSRAGITFTRQQRQLIISLIDAGRQAEAYKLIMEGVERQVGGAGNAQANETLAGSFDTIGQGVRGATRAFGSWVAQLSLVETIIDRTATAADRFTRQQLLEGTTRPDEAAEIILGFSGATLRTGIRGILDEVDRFGVEWEDLDIFDRTRRGSRLADQESLLEFMEILAQRLREATPELDLAGDAVNKLMSTLERRAQNLTDLQAQVDMQRELVGLTEEEARVQRILNDLGFGSKANIQAEIRATAEAIERLAAAGGDVSELEERLSELESQLSEVNDSAKEMRKVFEDQRIGREINRIEDSAASTNAVLRRQVEILEEARAAGNDALTVTEARRQAELEAEVQTVRTQKAIAAAAAATALLAMNFAEAAKQAAEVARLALIIQNLEDNAALQLRLGDLGRTGRGGGGGAGTDPNAEFQRELDSLTQYLERRREEMMIARGFEREIIIEQYQERLEILQNARDRELISLEEFNQKEIDLAQSKADRIAEIERNAANARMRGTADLFGALSGIAQAGGDRLVKVAAATAGIQATINSYVAATEALRTQGLSLPERFAAYASVLATGLGAVRSIAQAGGGGGGGAAARTADAPREMREVSPQRVLIQGLNPDDLFTGQMLENLFESLYDENDNRGRVFVVAR